MKILVFGSANIDRVYSVGHFVTAGETLSADGMELFCGGKGFNQAIALARAGAEVYFAGAVGEDGAVLRETLVRNGVDVRFLRELPGPSGHAVIQVTPDGRNCIMILAGANGKIDPPFVEDVLDFFSEGDLVLLQNEISCVDRIISEAKRRGLLVAINPSPFNDKLDACDFRSVDCLLVNEVEGAQLTGKSEPDEIVTACRRAYPETDLILTLGAEGSRFSGRSGEELSCGIYRTEAVDTTAAGDTFTGYFLSEALSTGDHARALRLAAVASGISVSRKGASPSIPVRSEVLSAEAAF